MAHRTWRVVLGFLISPPTGVYSAPVSGPNVFEVGADGVCYPLYKKLYGESAADWWTYRGGSIGSTSDARPLLNSIRITEYVSSKGWAARIDTNGRLNATLTTADIEELPDA